jgi:ABC-2 type transport system permease protein
MLRIHLTELKYELLKTLRIPAFVVPAIAFPTIFYIFFGVLFGKGAGPGGVTVAAYMIATYGSFGVIGASLFGLGAGVAIERGQGWLQVKRTTPMPLSAYFGAKIGVALLFSCVIVLLLFVLGATLGHVHLAPMVWPALLAVIVAGSLPFCALGLVIGYFAGPNSAPPMVNLIFLPMAFLSGQWIPIDFLPPAIQKIALFLPAYHHSQLALGVLGAGRGTALWHVVALFVYAALFLVIARIGYRRDEGKTYG